MVTPGPAWLAVALLILVLIACNPSRPEETRVPASEETVIKEAGANENSTLTIPRYKIYQDPDSPDRIWVGLGVTSGGDTYYSDDGGRSWMELGAMGWEYHMSMAGNKDGYIHFVNRGTPSATYYRLRDTVFESDAQASFNDYGDGTTTSGNIAVNGDEVVIFTRERDDGSIPIAYHRSVDNGRTWESGVVQGTGNPYGIQRVGSCVIDGQVTLAYWKERGADTGDTVTLFRWDGNSFAPIDHVYTTATSNPYSREYGITQDASGVIHLVTWDQVNGETVVRHAHRTLGTNWSTPETVVTWDNVDISPQISAYGDSVLLFYLYNADSSLGEDARVYYKVWDNQNGWSPEGTPLSGTRARYPLAPQQVSTASPFVPVIWTEGESVRFFRLTLR